MTHTCLCLAAGFSNATAIHHILSQILSSGISLSTSSGSSVAALICSFQVCECVSTLHAGLPGLAALRR